MLPPAAPALHEQLDRRLQRLEQRHPELAAAIRLQGALTRERLTLAQERTPEIGDVLLPRERATAKIRAGIPLLHDEPAFVDVDYAANLLGRLANAATGHGEPETAERVQPLVAALAAGLLEPDRLLAEAFVQHREHVSEMAVFAEVDPDLLVTLTALAVAPLLRAHAERLAPILERVGTDAHWERGYCPVCGAWPLLAELRGTERHSHLRCLMCGAGWPSRRLRCAYCENEDVQQIYYLQLEGEPRFKAEVCDRCKGYLKVANAFEPSPAELLALDDLASVGLDLAATERGYQRPTTTGFHLEIALPEDEADEWASLE